MKHLKAKQDYGLETTKMQFNELKIGNKSATTIAPQLARFARFYTLMEQDVEHPILVKGDQLYNGGLRVSVAIEKGYDSIDAIVSDDEDLLNKLIQKQRNDAHKFFPVEQLEGTEQIEMLKTKAAELDAKLKQEINN